MNKNVEERLLGMMAVEKRLITEKQLTECLNIQEFFDPRPLMQLFLEKGYLTEQQVAKLQTILNQQTQPDADRFKKKSTPQKLFGELAIESYMITREQLEECLKEQEESDQRGNRLQIGQILIGKSYMTPTQVTRILEMQSKKVLCCKGCKSSYTVLNYREDQFYHCKKCGLDLVESEVIPVQKKLVKTGADPRKTTSNKKDMIEETEEFIMEGDSGEIVEEIHSSSPSKPPKEPTPPSTQKQVTKTKKKAPGDEDLPELKVLEL